MELSRPHVLCVFVATLMSCKSGDQPMQPEACMAGTVGCSCNAGNCGEALGCDTGFCVPQGCERGTQGCSCHPDGTCFSLEGTPLSCIGNICVVSVIPERGSLNGPCDIETPCSDGGGAQLACIDGACERPDCPSGVLGCPCGPYGACSSYMERQARCLGGTCALGDCAPGSDGCRCDSGGGCSSGLACSHGVCRSIARQATLHVASEAVRACDVLVLEQSGAVERVIYAGTVQGHFLRRSPKVALSFIARDDVPFAAAVATIETRDSASAAGAGLQVSKATCYDRLGAPVPSVVVTLE